MKASPRPAGLAPVIDLGKARNRRERRQLQRMTTGFGSRLGAPHRTSELYAHHRLAIELERVYARARRRGFTDAEIREAMREAGRRLKEAAA